jgi:hypothetical protein
VKRYAVYVYMEEDEGMEDGSLLSTYDTQAEAVEALTSMHLDGYIVDTEAAT